MLDDGRTLLGLCNDIAQQRKNNRRSRIDNCYHHQWTRIAALTGLAHSSRAKHRYNESLVEITNPTVKIQKTAQHIIKLRNVTTFAYYMIC